MILDKVENNAEFEEDVRSLVLFRGRLIKGLIDLNEKDPTFTELLTGVVETRLDGIDRYGALSYDDLGARGVFVDVHRKHIRLQRHFWDGEEIGSEKIEDSMFDNIVYILLLFKSYLGDKLRANNEGNTKNA